MLLIHRIGWKMFVPFPFYTVIYVFCGEIRVDVKAESWLCYGSTHVCCENSIGSRNFLVIFYGLTLGGCRLFLSTMISPETDNLYLCNNLHETVQYSACEWRYYPKRYFSIQNGVLLQRMFDGRRSAVVLVLSSFPASTHRIKTAMNVVCSLTTVLVIFMSFVLRTVRAKLTICLSVILWLPEKNLIILYDQQSGVNYSHTSINTNTTEWRNNTENFKLNRKRVTHREPNY